MLCIIPARGGSKRIPRKALEKINGQTMLHQAIEKALSITLIDDIFVSTDDSKIGKEAILSGAEYIERDKSLADDFIGVGEALGKVVRDLLISKELNKEDYILTLFPCTPLLRTSSLQQFILETIAGNFSSGMIVKKYSHPIQRCLSRNSKGEMSIDDFYSFQKRTQDLDEKFHDAGQGYITKIELITQGKLIDDSPYGFVDQEVVDIDNIDDLNYARTFLKRDEKGFSNSSSS